MVQRIERLKLSLRVVAVTALPNNLRTYLLIIVTTLRRALRSSVKCRYTRKRLRKADKSQKSGVIKVYEK